LGRVQILETLLQLAELVERLPNLKCNKATKRFEASTIKVEPAEIDPLTAVLFAERA